MRPERQRDTDRDRATDRNRDRPSDRQERQIETKTVERDGDREAAGRRDRQQRKSIITDDYFWWRRDNPNTSFARLSLKSALSPSQKVSCHVSATCISPRESVPTVYSKHPAAIAAPSVAWRAATDVGATFNCSGKHRAP